MQTNNVNCAKKPHIGSLESMIPFVYLMYG